LFRSGAEVALAVDQRVAQVPRLRQPHHGVVDGLMAVWVVLADDLADHTGALGVPAVRRQPHLVHGEQDASLHRLEAVAHVGQSAVDDDRHGVVDEPRLDLVRDGDRDDLTFVQRDLLGPRPAAAGEAARPQPQAATRWSAGREPCASLTDESTIREGRVLVVAGPMPRTLRPWFRPLAKRPEVRGSVLP